ncbi:hypothetical protein BSKO_06070 [Bryopsis sp. KO-2023]|nr:hypothetical protein BSKO_06070 [Bryopsis sp. KO-2023]
MILSLTLLVLPIVLEFLGGTAEAYHCSQTDLTTAAIEDCVNAVRTDPNAWTWYFYCGISGLSSAPALTLHSKLKSSAAGHAADMAGRGYISHWGSNGSTLKERVWNSAGFGGNPIAENVASGQKTAIDVIEGWMCSESHRKAMMSCDFNVMGIAMQCNSEKCFVAQNLGCFPEGSCSCDGKKAPPSYG